MELSDFMPWMKKAAPVGPAVQPIVNQAAAPKVAFPAAPAPVARPIAPVRAKTPAPAPAPAPVQKTPEQEMREQLDKEVKSTVSELEQNKEMRKAMAPEQAKEMDKLINEQIASLKDKQAKMDALQYNPVKLPTSPELKDTQKQLGNIVPVLTALIGIASVLHGGNSAANFANTYNGMVEGFRWRDYQDFKAKSEEFRGNLESAMRTNQERLQEYTSAMNKIIAGQGADKEILDLRMKQKEAPYQMLLAERDALTKNLDIFDKFQTHREAAEMKKIMEKDRQEREKFDRWYKTEDLKLKSKKATGGMNNYTLSDAENIALQRAISEGRLDANRINSRTAKMLSQLFIGNPKLDMNNSAATAEALDKIESQRSLTETFESTASKNFDLVEKLYDKNPQGAIYWLNKLANNFNVNITGDAQSVQTGRAIKTALFEYAKVVSGQTGGAAVSDSAREEVATLLSMSDNPAAFHGSIANHRIEMKNRMDGFDETIQKLKVGRGGNVRGNGANASSSVIPQEKWTVGRVYKDASGKQAKYLGNGQWQAQ